MPTLGGSRGSSALSSPLSVSVIRNSRMDLLMLFAGRKPWRVISRPLRRITSRPAMGNGKRPRGASQRGSGIGSSVSLHEQRVRRVEEAFRTLPSRYLGAEDDFDATFQVRLGDVGRTWQV